MNKIYKKEYHYLRLYRTFTKRDKYACMALYHNYNSSYYINFKNLKGKRMVLRLFKKGAEQ